MSGTTTLLFDLDGTLTNPAPGFLASLRYAFDEMGIESPAESELLKFIGPPLRTTMGTVMQTEDQEMIETAVKHYRYRLDNGGKFEAEIYPGILDVLEHFTAKGFNLYVCTGKPVGVATEIVHHFGIDRFFRKVYGAELDGRFCDKADLIRHIWKNESIPSPAGVMTGDTLFDLKGAQANNLKSIAVDWGFGCSNELQNAGPDEFVTSPEQLIPAIERLV